MSGVRVASGSVRVDARRALAKLREYQLADPHAYLTEFARGVLAQGASDLRVDWDADDVWLGWCGAELPADAVVGILDTLVSPETRETRGLRPIARAVNTALRLNPKFVELRRGEVAIRFTAGRGAEIDAPTVHRGPPAARSQHLEGSQSVLQVRGRFGLDVVSRYLRQRLLGASTEISVDDLERGDVPEAVSSLARSSAWGRADVSFRGSRLTAPESLVTFPLPHGALVVRAQAEGRGRWEVAEKGLVISTEPMVTAAPVAGGAESARESPLGRGVVAFVDLEHVPTNASRSRVRWEHPSMRAVHEAVEGALPRLMKRWAVGIRGEIAERSADDCGPLRRAALAFIGSYTHGPRWRWGILDVPRFADPLLMLPLALDASGALASLRDFEFREACLRAPLSDDQRVLLPYYARVLLAPPGSPESLLVGDPTGPERNVSSVQSKARRARDSYREKPPRTPRLEPGASPVRKFESESIERGEVVLVDEEHGRRPHASGVVVLYTGGRPFQTLTMSCPVAFDAFVELPDDRIARAFGMSVNSAERSDLTRQVLREVFAAWEGVLATDSDAVARFPPERAAYALDMMSYRSDGLSDAMRALPLFRVVEPGARIERRSLAWLAARDEMLAAVVDDGLGSPTVPDGHLAVVVEALSRDPQALSRLLEQRPIARALPRPASSTVFLASEFASLDDEDLVLWDSEDADPSRAVSATAEPVATAIASSPKEVLRQPLEDPERSRPATLEALYASARTPTTTTERARILDALAQHLE